MLGKMMIRLSIMFFVIALIAAVFGFGGIAAAATDIAVFIFYVFIVLFALALVFAIVDGRRTPRDLM